MDERRQGPRTAREARTAPAHDSAHAHGLALTIRKLDAQVLGLEAERDWLRGQLGEALEALAACRVAADVGTILELNLEARASVRALERCSKCGVPGESHEDTIGCADALIAYYAEETGRCSCGAPEVCTAPRFGGEHVPPEVWLGAERSELRTDQLP